MADIAMCFGDGCELREKCYRYTAPINRYAQTVLSGKKEQPCKFFWDNTGMIDGRKIGHWWDRRADNGESN